MSKDDVFNLGGIVDLRVHAVGQFSDVLMTIVDETQVMNRYGYPPEAKIEVLNHPLLFRLAHMMSLEYSSAKLIGLGTD
jgi:hypothetical protein